MAAGLGTGAIVAIRDGGGSIAVLVPPLRLAIGLCTIGATNWLLESGERGSVAGSGAARAAA